MFIQPIFNACESILLHLCLYLPDNEPVRLLLCGTAAAVCQTIRLLVPREEATPITVFDQIADSSHPFFLRLASFLQDMTDLLCKCLEV